MSFSGPTSMAPTSVIFPASLPTEEDIVLSRDSLKRERQKAYVLIIGSGLASPWCSLWIFENGDVFSMELTNRLMGSRWHRSRYKMRWLHSAATVATQSTPCDSPPLSLKEDTGSSHVEDTVWETSLELQGHVCYCAFQCGRPSDTTDDRRSMVAASVEHMWSECGRQLETGHGAIEDCVHNFLEMSGDRHYIMSPSLKYQGGALVCSHCICMQDTSPHDLRARARAVPLNDAWYDLFLHNSQLFIVQLLCGQYDAEFNQLPLAVGSIAAVPVLLALEVIFVAAFQALLCWQRGFATLVGLSWVAVEIHHTWRYAYYNVRPTSGVVIGGICTMCVWGAAAMKAEANSAYTDSLLTLSLIWDSCMVAEALIVNMVYRDHRLQVLNLASIVLGYASVAVLQWLNGWPVQDLIKGSATVLGVVFGWLAAVFLARHYPLESGALLCAATLVYMAWWSLYLALSTVATIMLIVVGYILFGLLGKYQVCERVAASAWACMYPSKMEDNDLKLSPVALYRPVYP